MHLMSCVTNSAQQLQFYALFAFRDEKLGSLLCIVKNHIVIYGMVQVRLTNKHP
jgi:hypothetical protein